MNYSKNEAKIWARSNLKGLVSSLFTPLTDDDELDEEGIKKLVKRCIDVGSDALIWGAADFFTFTLEERKKVAECIVDEVNGKIPVIMMTAAHCAKDCLDLTKHAEEIGVDLAMIMTPYLYAKSDESIYNFYKYIADQVNIGISLYNTIPAGYILTPEFITILAQKIPNICAIRNGQNDLAHTI